ncbi:hypothetical protein COT97_01510 [Candidatus Falkowbacteria bacterium CG10_big_fil_rev_8_21_14_0_10_39_11]|uniref:VWFA domain-containing protein n=1 Tax=Candidatus Falkowbacteria bacterium CG10_big_fil_rev_8_21_14_0_10_39_11 TaxID=1974565 RepID=A0A2H0V5M6_9BACT|nr:MAG: hypothetical protein COT97_01510 [Candidatus Falkowbacteria bacterium CG10_big_fil_rev_8_21_14_0_10_39_11]
MSSDIEKREKSGAMTSGGTVSISAIKRRRESEKSVSDLVRVVKMNPKLQLILMFDITASMFGYFEEVRKHLAMIVAAVRERVPRSEFAIFAFRNHGDKDRYDQIFYTSPLTSDLSVVNRAIEKIRRGGGGPDALTCMEECLRAANGLSWKESAQKAIVVIGDMPPHGVLDSVTKCYAGIDYRQEVIGFKKKQIKVYSVFCGTSQRVRDFYQKMATDTNGRFMDFDSIEMIVELIVGVSMKETGNLDKFLADLRSRKQLSPAKERVLKLLE